MPCAMFSVVTHNQNIDVCVSAVPNVTVLMYLRGVCLVYKHVNLAGEGVFNSSGVVHRSQQSTRLRAPLPRACRDDAQDP